MNLNIIHVEHIKPLPISNLIILLLLILLIIALFSFAAIETFNEINKVLGIFLLIIPITIFLYTIKIIPEIIEERKIGGTYTVYLDDKENAKEISKEEYNFIQNVKDKNKLGDKPTKDEIKKIKDIVLKKI